MAKSPVKAPKPTPGGVLISRGGVTLGPYREAQIAEMVREGVLSTVDLAWREGRAEWQPLFSLGIKGCMPPPPPSRSDSINQIVTENSQSNTFYQTLELQSRMKSKSVAVLLAIFFPFLGCLYSAPIAAIVCLITGTIMFTTGMDGMTLILFSISYIVSIFRALAGVDRYNAKLIQLAKQSVQSH